MCRKYKCVKKYVKRSKNLKKIDCDIKGSLFENFDKSKDSEI
jgi:hypothetical protein